MWPQVPDWWLPAVQAFVTALQPVFWDYAQQRGIQVYVSSWGRSRAHNASVQGVGDSQHLVWTAADLVPSDGDLDSLAAYAQQLPGISYVLVEGTQPGSTGPHVHVQAYPAGYIPAWVFEAVAA